MKQIEKIFEKNGFKFEQVFLDYPYAIYKRWKEGIGKPHFEAIIIQECTEYEIAGNIIPEHQAYPGNEKWGQLAYTCENLDKAKIRLDQLKKWNNSEEKEKEVEEIIEPQNVKRGRGRPKGSKNKN